MLTEALFYNSPNWKYPKCTSPVEWLNFDIDMQQSITQRKKKKKRNYSYMHKFEQREAKNKYT